MDIRIDDLQGAAIAALLQVHLDAMHRHSPPESVHALDLEALRHPSITFWTAWDGEALLGCGALKTLSQRQIIAHYADIIRALLLAGIRAAFLWRQLGGRRWRLLLQRKKLLQASQNLSRGLGVV